MAEPLKDSIGNRAHIGCEADTENVERVDFPGAVSQANQVNGPLTIGENRFKGILRTFVREIAKKGIAGAKWEKTEGNPLGIGMARKDAIDDFVRGAVAADGQKISVALSISLASKFAGVARSRGGDDIHFDAVVAKASERIAS